MDPANDRTLGISIGQRAFVDMFGGDGERLKLSGPVTAIDGGVIRLVVEHGSVNKLLCGTCVMVECQAGTERLRFVSNLIDIEVGLDKGAQLLLEAPPHVAQLQARKFNRYDIRVPVDYSVEGGAPRRGTTEDLGGNGARVLAEQTAPLGSSVALKFDLGDSLCEASGKIKHAIQIPGVEGVQWGVQFSSMDPTNAARLWSFLKHHLLARR